MSTCGSDALWDQSEEDLKLALEDMNIPYDLAVGEGAFYGPKVEFHIIDGIGRSWQLGTIQLDYAMPDRFGLKYIGEDNMPHTPVMLHRAILGTLERFIGVYLEHCSGRLPTWLSPCQVRILNITDEQNSYCQAMVKELKNIKVRVEYDSRAEKLGYKIRQAQMEKIPYIMIVGQKEVAEQHVSIRSYGNVQRNGIPKESFLHMIKDDIQRKSLEPPFLEGVK